MTITAATITTTIDGTVPSVRDAGASVCRSRLGGESRSRVGEDAMTDEQMVCPRCHGSMSTFDRAGVQVDQCENCRGIFLDRGELERLVEAESTYYNAPAPPAPGPGAAYPQPESTYPQSGYAYDRPGYGSHHGHHEDYDEHHGYRRRGFFHDLFDD